MSQPFIPAYLKLLKSDELSLRVEQAYPHLEDCDLCARFCHINRRLTIKGAVCHTGEHATVNSFMVKKIHCVDDRVPERFF